MSEHNAQQSASSQQAQQAQTTVTNIAPGEQPAKPADYADFMQQLTDLETQITKASSNEEMEGLKQKVAALEAEVAKKATKRSLSRKLSELKQNLQPNDEDEEEVGTESEACTEKAAKAKQVEPAAGAGEPKRVGGKGKGIVALEELNKDALGNYGWFKDLMKAHKKLVGFQ